MLFPQKYYFLSFFGVGDFSLILLKNIENMILRKFVLSMVSVGQRERKQIVRCILSNQVFDIVNIIFFFFSDSYLSYYIVDSLFILIMKTTDELLLVFHIIKFIRLSQFNFCTFRGKNTLEWLNFFSRNYL